MAKKKRNKLNPFIRILICIILVYGFFHSLAILSLSFFGETTLGVLDSYDSRRDDANAGQNQSRTITKTYHFSVDGKEYRGRAMYSSDEAWQSLGEGETRTEAIRYLGILPYISKPAMLTDIDTIGPFGLIHYIIYLPGCIFLFLLVNGWLGKKKKAARKAATIERNITRRDAAMFCENCGAKLKDGAVFCANCGRKVQKTKSDICVSCGAKIPEDAAFCINCGAKAQSPPTSAPASSEVYNMQQPNLGGFSARYNAPEILAAAEKNRKSSIGCMWVLVFAPLIGFPLAGLLMEDFPLGEAVIIGVGVALVMLIVNLLGLRSAKKPMWEGVVVNKYRKERSEHNRTEGETDTYSTYMEYTTVIRTDAGKKKTIVEKDSGRDMHDYLAVGDRVRYHPVFGTYEKYDKSKDRIIYCNVCRMLNPIANDRCKRCNNLLFK
ncbi:MAG: zinc ribbon domain-containing protein [Eubacteriales bacterium]|nr:zinc ribbon domain-containing protein [Eubacteriales bacterium]MDD3073721.1 zinc ribbon domain-containing protein [Eubacteriales bacterium]